MTTKVSLTSIKVNDFFKEMNLEVRQIDKIYEYLEAHNIVVLNPIKEMIQMMKSFWNWKTVMKLIY